MPLINAQGAGPDYGSGIGSRLVGGEGYPTSVFEVIAWRKQHGLSFKDLNKKGLDHVLSNNQLRASS